MVKFLILRHGYSESNVNKTLTGQLDALLSEKGVKQSECACEYILRNYNVDAIYSSDLSRAVCTVKPLSDATGLPIIKNEAFREVNCGKWQGQKISYLRDNFDDLYVRWSLCEDGACPPDGETMLSVQERAIAELKNISLNLDGKTVVVATHGGVIKTLHGAFLNLPPREWSEKLPFVANAALTEVDFDGKQFKVIKLVNDDYLGDLKTQMPKGI